MIAAIAEKQTAIAELCSRFGVRKLELFGSAATGDFEHSRSEVDFIVEFPENYDFGPWLSRLSQFERSLTALFDFRVNLISPSALRNPWFRREAEKARVTVYHASGEPEIA